MLKVQRSLPQGQDGPQGQRQARQRPRFKICHWQIWTHQCGLVDLRFGVKFDMISQVLPDKC